MGVNFSQLLAGQPAAQPKTVLVPPMFERDLKGRSRMVRPSYDYLFSKPALRWLFQDYMGAGLNTVLLFAPAADPRVSVKAKLGASEAATMCIRYQPYGSVEPLCFIDVKASPKSPGDVTLRGCAFSTATGLGAFAVLPLAKEVSGKRAQLGLRYSSPVWTAGAVLQPATNQLSHAWLCGRQQGVTLGVQVRPGLALHDVRGSLEHALAALPSSGSGGGGGGSSDTLRWLRSVSSVALSYSPEARTRGGQHAFTASVEMQEGRAFVISFFQHMAAVRQVFNPLEKDDVIGITNYIDIGLQLTVPLAPAAAVAAAPASAKQQAASGGSAGGGGGDALGAAGLTLAGAWQVNKNVYLKARLSAEGAAAMAAFKSWFVPSLALAAVAEHSFVSGKTRGGVTLQIENFGRLRYERSRAAMEHGRTLTQRHEATEAELAMAEGERPLVARRAADEAFNPPEPESSSYL